MALRKDYILVVKPICAAALVGVVVSLLRIVISREVLGRGPMETTLLLFLACICLSLHFLDTCRPNTVAHHGTIGLVAGLVTGFFLARHDIGVAWEKGVSDVDRRLAWVAILIMALIGSLAGIVIGAVRRAVARRFGRPAKWCDVEPVAKELDEFRPRVSARQRVIPLAVFGVGLVVVFLLFVVDPPVIDSRGVAETLVLGGEADARSPEPIRSPSQVWQSSGVEALAFSSDGKYLATGGHDGTIGIWSAGDWTRAGEIKQEGWIARLAFSPDGEWLYVAGDDGRRGALCCRFRWRTGKQDKVFDGHKRPVDGMALSADGRTLVSSSFLGNELRTWDAISGASLGSFVSNSPSFAYASRRNLIFQWARSGTGHTTAYLDGAKVPRVWFPGKPMAAAFAPDEQLLVAARQLHSAAQGAEVSLGIFVLEGDQRAETRMEYRSKREVQFPSVWDDQAALAISPDGQRVAVASGDVRLAVYGMPDLEMIKEYHYPVHSKRSQRILQLDYSPDGKWLAAAQMQRTTPRLFDAVTAEEWFPDKRNRIQDLRFSADGRALRTVDADGSVCFWDVTNLALLRKVSIPAGYVVGSIRPSDGRYALCSDAPDATLQVHVVDLDTGKSICQASLLLPWEVRAASRSLAHAGNVHWLSDREVIHTGRFLHRHNGAFEDWWRLNYQTGDLIELDNPLSIPVEGARSDLEPKFARFRSDGDVTEDGKHLFVIGGGGKGDPPNLAGQIDLETLQTTDLGRIDRPADGPFGLVPGGKYFHLGLHIYDRRSLNLVAAKDFPRDRVTIGTMTFSPDGSRYAASLWQHNLGEQPRAAVLVHGTLTSRILAAFLPPSRVALLRFSQDGTQLAVAYDDGTLELRTVPSGKSARPVVP
jgi:WD40 repeat protein